MTRPSTTQPAGFAVRLAAFLIDNIILYPPSLLLAILFEQVTFTAVVLGLALHAAYASYFVASHWCATPGKRLLGLVVLTHEGERLSLRRAFERFLASIMPFLVFYSSSISPESAMVLMFWLSLLWYGLIAVTAQRTGLHDILCGTRVFHGKTEERL